MNGDCEETESPKVGLEHKEVQKLWGHKIIRPCYCLVQTNMTIVIYCPLTQKILAVPYPALFGLECIGT